MFLIGFLKFLGFLKVSLCSLDFLRLLYDSLKFLKVSFEFLRFMQVPCGSLGFLIRASLNYLELEFLRVAFLRAVRVNCYFLGITGLNSTQSCFY